MKFVIGDPVKTKQTPKNQYVLEIKTMLGDGDRYETITIGPFNENQLHLLEEVYNVCKAMKKIDNPRHDDRGYSMIKGFNFWFEDSIVEDEKGNPIEYDPRYKFSYTWPSDYDSGYYSSIQYFNVFYYNNFGEKFNVKVLG